MTDNKYIATRLKELEDENDRLKNSIRELELRLHDKENDTAHDLNNTDGKRAAMNSAISDLANNKEEYEELIDRLSQGLKSERDTNKLIIDEIEQRKKTELALKESEEQFRNIVYNMPIMIHAHGDNMEYVFWNKESERVTGYSAEEVLYNPEATDKLKVIETGEGADYLNMRLEVQNRDATYREFEAPIRCADGKEKIIAWSNVSDICPVPGWTRWEIGRDVTYEVESRKKLRESEQRTRQIFQLSPDPIFLHRNGRCLYANPAGNVIFGYSGLLPKLDMPLSEIFYELPEAWTTTPQPQVTGESCDEVMVRATGQHLEVHSSAILLHGQPTFLTIARNITDRKLFEEDILRSRDIGRALVDATNDHLALLNKDLEVIACNVAFAEVARSHPRLIVKRPYKDIVPESLYNATYPIIEDCFNSKNNIEAVILHENSTLDIAIRPILNDNNEVIYFALAMHDVTSAVIAERTQRQTEYKYKAVFDQAKDVIFIVDTQGIFLEINPALKNLLQYTDDFFEDIDIRKLTDDNDSGKFFDFFESGQESFSASLSFRSGSNQILPLEINANRIEYYNEDAYLCIGRDLTEWRKAATMLQQAKESAEANNRLKDEFVANISHELRTPLSSIIGIADILINDSLTTTQKDYVYKITSTADILLKLINDLLDLSRIEAETFALSKGVFSLDSTISNVKDAFSFALAEKNLTLTISIEQSIPDMMVGDSLRLLQVVYNLIGNAIKFTKEGFISLKIVQDKSEQPNDDDTLQLVVSVQDTGIGIEKDKLRLIFQRFYQADTFLSREHSGTGLGLFISKKLVEKMGGSIWVESTVGKGTTFYFTIKLTRANASQVIEAKQQKQKPHNKVRPLKVLVVEDNALYRSIISQLIRSDNHIVATASDGFEAVAALELEEFDVVFLDLQMPHCDGFQTTRLIREHKNPRVAKTPIIALSAHAQKDYELKCAQAGMNSYLSKPVRQNQLRTELIKLFPESNELEPDQPNTPQEAGPSEEKTSISEQKASLIDFDTLRKHVGDSEEMLLLSCSKFLDHSSKYIEDLQHAVNEKNQEELKRLAHSFKSITSTFGCTKTYEKLVDLEKNSATYSWSTIEASVASVVEMTHQIEKEARDYVDTAEG